MIEKYKVVGDAIWQKQDAKNVGGLLVEQEIDNNIKKDIMTTVFGVLEEMKDMKIYGYPDTYLDQIKVVFVEKMLECNMSCEDIKPVLLSIDNGRVKHNTILMAAVHFKKINNQDAVDVLMPIIDITGGSRNLSENY
jgi:hypothetical protein